MTVAQRIQKKSIRVGGDMHQRYIEKSLSTATCAINKLQREGFSVEHVELGGGGRPRIKISWSPQCVRLGEPSVYSRGNNGVHYETYQVQYEGCQVSWIRK